MEQVRLFWFYQLGQSVANLHSAALADYSLTNWRWKSALDNAAEWLTNTEKMDPPVVPKTIAAAGVCRIAIQEFSKLLGQDRTALPSEWSSVTSALTKFQNVFEQELEDAYVFFVTPIGAYSVSALIDEAEKHLSVLALGSISKDAKVDFQKAGACLALDLFTACGFHSMRALEAEARQYHHRVTGHPVLTDIPLGPLINGRHQQKADDFPGLKDQYDKEGARNDSKLGLVIAQLSLLNKIYRCPLMHPEMTLNRGEAKQVFDISAISISLMIEDAFERKKAAKAALIPTP